MKINRSTWLLFSIFAVLLMGAGLSYAWFSHNIGLTTLMEIQPPDTIKIIPISAKNGAEMTELDLDFNEEYGDTKDQDGTIHIRRPVCIKSTMPVHQLEVVHTTNLKQLSFQIFPAVKQSDGSFTYNTNQKVSGAYKNQQGENLAEEETLENYKSTADVADVHAYPLYWLAVNCGDRVKAGSSWQEGWQEVTSETQVEYDPAKQENKTFYYTYYYIEISWLETTKETDLFYVMAQNIAE